MGKKSKSKEGNNASLGAVSRSADPSSSAAAGRPQPASQASGHSVKRHPWTDGLRVHVMDVLGELEVRRGDANEAIGATHRAAYEWIAAHPVETKEVHVITDLQRVEGVSVLLGAFEDYYVYNTAKEALDWFKFDRCLASHGDERNNSSAE